MWKLVLLKIFTKLKKSLKSVINKLKKNGRKVVTALLYTRCRVGHYMGVLNLYSMIAVYHLNILNNSE